MRRRYEVKVQFTQERTVRVYGRDEQEAQERAVDIVSKWKDVFDAEAQSAVETHE